MIFKQVLSLFQNNKKRTTPSKQEAAVPQSPTTATTATLNPSAQTSFTSSVSNQQPLTPSSAAPPPPPPPPHHSTATQSDIQIPQVEFEQSRSLLQLDFFGPDQQFTTNFPQFDHLLSKPPSVSIKAEAPEQKTKLGTLNRKLTKTLRHRISIYRPNHNNAQLKRSTSSPHLA